MSTPSISFDRMERDADQALAVVLWAKHAKNTAVVMFLFALMNHALKGLVKSLSAEHLNTLSAEQAIDLKRRLQEVHAELGPLVNHYGMKALAQRSLFRSSIEALEENTADLDDIIEELVLSENSEFRSLLSECADSVNSHRRAGNLVRM